MPDLTSIQLTAVRPSGFTFCLSWTEPRSALLSLTLDKSAESRAECAVCVPRRRGGVSMARKVSHIVRRGDRVVSTGIKGAKIVYRFLKVANPN